MGKKFSRRIHAGRSRDLPTDNKLAASPRNRFYDLTSAPGVPVVGRDSALRCPDATPRRPYLGATEGVGASRPDSSIVGRIGSNPWMFVPPDLAARDELLCSTGVSLFTGLCVSGTAGFAIGALSTSGSRVFADCETDRSFGPSAARAPAARISSSVSLGGADFFSRGLDLCGVGVVDSEASCSEGCCVCVERSDFFSRATMTSCACIFPMRTTLKSITGKNRFSMTPPDKRFSPFTTLHS